MKLQSLRIYKSGKEILDAYKGGEKIIEPYHDGKYIRDRIFEPTRVIYVFEESKPRKRLKVGKHK